MKAPEYLSSVRRNNYGLWSGFLPFAPEQSSTIADLEAGLRQSATPLGPYQGVPRYYWKIDRVSPSGGMRTVIYLVIDLDGPNSRIVITAKSRDTVIRFAEQLTADLGIVPREGGMPNGRQEAKVSVAEGRG